MIQETERNRLADALFRNPMSIGGQSMVGSDQSPSGSQITEPVSLPFKQVNVTSSLKLKTLLVAEILAAVIFGNGQGIGSEKKETEF